MARSDYAHWNEDADYMWWQEEGRHETYDEPEDDPDAGWDDWDDDDDDDDEAIEPEQWYAEDLGWAGTTE